MNTSTNETKRGVTLCLAAYLIWGLFPLFFKTLVEVPAAEVLAHRILWAATFLTIFSYVGSRSSYIRSALASRRSVMVLICSTLLIATNWYVFIHAVDTDRVLEASLGYYITPLVNVLMGAAFLGERLTRLQWISIALAVAGVATKVWTVGDLPTISLILAASFGGYGFARKVNRVDTVTALTVETALLVPLAFGFAIYLSSTGRATFLAASTSLDLLLICSGVLTAIPLLLYGAALHNLKLSTLGFLQYIVPTMQFLLAVLVFNEPFTKGHLLSFSLIWAGLMLYSWEMQQKKKG